MATITNTEEIIDIAIITIIPEEYTAVHIRLQNPQLVLITDEQPNLYAWEIGTVEDVQRKFIFKVVLGMAGRPTGVSANQAITETINRWKPRYVILVGVAGGLPKEDLTKGDVVISEVIWDYEYGKISTDFIPRNNFTYQSDVALYTSALRISELSNEWKKDLGPAPEETTITPKVLSGPFASGDKIIDDISNDYFIKVLAAWPKLLAVEMEGGGAAAAIELAKAKGLKVGFLMVRGISDMPPNSKDPNNPKQHLSPEQITAIRDKWKKFAAAAAASFTINFIANGWPTAPLSNISNSETQASIAPVTQDINIQHYIINEEGFWEDLYSLMIKFYPTGPKDKHIWEKAGGDLSTIDTQSIGQDSWFKALQLLRNGGGGKNITQTTLISKMLGEFPKNEKVKDIAKKAGIKMDP